MQLDSNQIAVIFPQFWPFVMPDIEAAAQAAILFYSLNNEDGQSLMSKILLQGDILNKVLYVF